MAAEPLRAPAPEPESAPIETPKPEPASLNEVLTGKPVPEAPKALWNPEGLSLAESEQGAFERGREALEKKKEFDAGVETTAADFEQTTSGWWSKTKSAFSKAASWIRGEEEIKKLNERVAEVKSGYQKKAEAAVSEKTPAAEAPSSPPKAPKLSPEEKALEKSVQTKREHEELIRASKGLQGEKMVEEYLAIRNSPGKKDRYGVVAGVAFDPRKGEIRTTYEDGSSTRRYASGLVLRVLPGGTVETVHPEAQIVDEDEAEEEILTAGEKQALNESAKAATPTARVETASVAAEPTAPKWESDTKEAEIALRKIDTARTPEQFKAFLVESGWMKQEDVEALSDAQAEKLRGPLKEEIASYGGIVVDPDAPPEVEASPEAFADTAKMDMTPAGEPPAIPEANLGLGDVSDGVVKEEIHDVRPMKLVQDETQRVEIPPQSAIDTNKIDLKAAKKPTRPLGVKPPRPPAKTIEVGETDIVEEEAAAKETETPKNPYDKMTLSALEEQVAAYRLALANNPDEPQRWASKLPQMEESLARRSSSEGLAVEIDRLKAWKAGVEAQNAEMDTPEGMEKFVMETFAPAEFADLKDDGQIDESEGEYVRSVVEAWRSGADTGLQEQVLLKAERTRKNNQKRIADFDRDISSYEQKLAGGAETPLESAQTETVVEQAASPTSPEILNEKNPFAPEAMPGIIEAVAASGRTIKTPGSLREVLTDAKYEFPADMESSQLMELYSAYRKAAKKKPGKK